MSNEEIDEAANTVMKDRNFQLLEFLSKEGAVFKPEYDKLQKAMKLPPDASTNADISDELRQCYDNRRYCSIPAFFKTLLYLRKKRRDFSLVFRTHGREMPAIIEEFNLF